MSNLGIRVHSIIVTLEINKFTCWLSTCLNTGSVACEEVPGKMFNPNLVRVFGGSFWGGGGGGKITPCLKPVRIMLETSYLPRKYTPICSFRKYTFWWLGPLNFCWCQVLFLSKKVPLLKAMVWELCLRFF